MKKSIAIVALMAWPLFLNDLYLIPLGRTRLGLLWALDLIFFLLVPTGTLIGLVKCNWISLQEIGLAVPPKPLSILAGVGLCAFLVVAHHEILFPVLNQLPGRLYVGYDFPAAQPLRMLTIVYAAVSAGVLEEIVYRGVITTELGKHITSPIGLILLSCAIFGSIHWGEGPGKCLSMFCWAIIPTLWFVRYRSLWGPIACHTLYDFLVFTGTV